MLKEFIFNKHPEIEEGSHAILAPSQKLVTRENFSKEQLDNYIRSKYAAKIGTIIHQVCADSIAKRRPITKSGMRELIYDALWKEHIPDRLNDPDLYLETVIPYVKDGIGFEMTPEQPLVFLYPIAYGTADTIRFNPVKGTLRIHDLKTGKIPASLDQLIEYASLFFLEYHLKPADIEVTLCIYQNGEILTGLPKASDILPIMEKQRALANYIHDNYYMGV